MATALRVGIVGCGNIVRKHHLPNLLRHPDEFRVTSACDVDGPSASRVAEACGAKPFVDFRAMIVNEPLDAVLVATPHQLHAEPVLLAATRGLHVLLEKPMATTLDDCARMVAACERAGVVFMVAENERYKSNFRAVGKAIRDGLIGDVLAIRSDVYARGERRDEPLHWIHDPRQAGGGIVLALAIHRLDVMRWLGGSVQRVSACFDVGDPLEKLASVQMRFASGAIGHFLSADVPAPPPRSGAMFVMGSAGTIGVMLPGFGYQGPAMRFTPGAKEPVPLPLEREGLASDDAFEAELLHFATCVRSRLEPHTSGRDNLETMRLVFAIYESAVTGKSVELPTHGPDA